MRNKTPSIPSVLNVALLATFLATFTPLNRAPNAATVPATVHPSWTKIDLRPAGFEPKVAGFAFLPDGRLVVADWNAERDRGSPLQVPRSYLGRIFILSGVQGNTPNVSVQTFATGLEDPMGMTLVNDTIYVSGGNTVVRVIDADKNGTADRVDTVFILPGTPESGTDSLKPQHGRQEWLFGLLYQNGKFYVNPSSLDPSTSGAQQINPYRGTHLAITPGNGTTNKRGSFEIFSTGLRAPSGLGFGPENLHCVSDNQGEWMPASKLVCLESGKFYGAKKGPGGVAYTWDTAQETPPTLLLPQGDIGNSPTQPLYVPSGLYAGQMLMGDVRWGGVQRIFLEKNSQGKYQGAIFTFTGGLESGVFRMTWGPDGMLYLGMLGGGSDGSPLDVTQLYGLQKLRFNGDTTFEMLAVRARATGLEIEFTKPVDTTLAKTLSTYTVQTYYFVPSSGYGGNKTGTTTLTPQSIQISANRKKVFLALPGMQPATINEPQRVVYIRLNGMTSSTGQTAWTKETWYTLSAAGTGNVFDATPILGPNSSNSGESGLRAQVRGQNLVIETPFLGAYTLRLMDTRGVVLSIFQGSGSGQEVFPLHLARGKVLILEARGEGLRLRKTVVVP